MGYAVPRHGGKTLSLRGSGVEYIAVSTPGANAKGAWVEMTSSLAVAARALTVLMLGAGTGKWYLMDVGVGAAGAEQVMIANLPMQTFNDFAAEARLWRIPCAVAAGQRIAMRGQNSGVADGVRCAIMAHGGNPLDRWGTQRVVAYGHVPAASTGTQLDPGGVANTKGAYTQLVATTTYPIRKLWFSAVPPSNVVFCSWTVDLAIGGAGAEVIVVPDMPFHAADIGKAILPNTQEYDVCIPAGVRLAARAQCDSTNATGRLINVMLNAMG